MSADGTNAMFGTTASGTPLSHLDYGYIRKCTDATELEKIVKVLRSGEEGTYPDLTLFAEKQLESVNPKSKVLRKDIPVQSYRDLDSSERDQMTDDFKDWISEMNHKDSLLKKDCEKTSPNQGHLPPVRSSKTVGTATSDTKVTSDAKNKSKRTMPRGYQEWDKFNPDEELKTLEQKEEQELKKKREKAKINTGEAELPLDVETSGKSQAELTLLADREKDKGNEAFRCGDYKESLVYYSRSIQYKPSAASYNNRAFANLKLNKYKEAINDCNVVINMEPNNLKAFLRRALAHKGQGESASARRDLDKVLKIEPKNKRALELLSELSTNEEKSENNTNGETHTKKKGKRLKIIEVDNDEEAAVPEEKKPVDKANQDSNLSVESTDGNCLSSSSNDATSPSETSQNVDEKQPLQPDNNDEKPTGIDEKAHTEHKEIVAPSPPPVVELPAIVSKRKDEGMSLYKLGRYAEAAEKFTVAIEMLEKDKSQFKSALSSLLNNRAACMQRIGDAFGCIKDCTASLALIPGSVKPLLKRASSNEMLERYEESYVDFNSAALMDPSNLTAMNGKSRVSKHLINTYGNSWRGRIENIKVAETPTSSELLNTGTSSTAEKAFNILGNKQTKTASKPTNNFSNLTTNPSQPPTNPSKPTTDPSKPTINPSKPTTKSSIPTRDEQEKKEAVIEKTAEKTFEQCKEKGNAFVKQGKLEQAIQCYTDCVSLDPSKVAVYTNRALCYLRLEKFVLAEEDATKAIELQEDNVKAFYRRGLARKALQKYEEAAKDLVSLIKIDPYNASGKKELDIVLNLCREQRKKQKEANKSANIGNANSGNATKPNEKKNEKKVEQNKPTQRRRVQIQEVDEVENISSNTASVSQKPAESVPSKANNNSTKKSVPAEETKPKTSPLKDQKKKKIILHKATAFDFYQAWNSVKQKDLSSYADILRQLNPKMLPKVLSNKLDADMFRCIIGAVSEHLLPSGEEKLSFGVLRYLCDAQRFDMVKMFLDSKDSKLIRDLYSKLASARTKNEFVDVDTFNGVLNKYNM